MIFTTYDKLAAPAISVPIIFFTGTSTGESKAKIASYNALVLVWKAVTNDKKSVCSLFFLVNST